MHDRPLYLVFCLFIIAIFIACDTNPDVDPDGSVSFPDFSQCDCDFASREIVCTEDGKWFRSACFANCLGYDDLITESDSCPVNVNPLDTLTWPVQLFCHPIEPWPPILATLSDSTVIFEVNDSTYIRAIPFDMCRCLPPQTQIASLQESISIADLLVGDSVLTLNKSGEEVMMPILFVHRVEVEADHQLLLLRLEDGRELSATPEHPDRFGRPLEVYEIGDNLDGSVIIEKRIIPYKREATWDILPAGETGAYQANGIWIGSTLKELIP